MREGLGGKILQLVRAGSTPSCLGCRTVGLIGFGVSVSVGLVQGSNDDLAILQIKAVSECASPRRKDITHPGRPLEVAAVEVGSCGLAERPRIRDREDGRSGLIILKIDERHPSSRVIQGVA